MHKFFLEMFPVGTKVVILSPSGGKGKVVGYWRWNDQCYGYKIEQQFFDGKKWLIHRGDFVYEFVKEEK